MSNTKHYLEYKVASGKLIVTDNDREIVITDRFKIQEDGSVVILGLAGVGDRNIGVDEDGKLKEVAGGGFGDISTNRLLGRASSGAGAVEQLRVVGGAVFATNPNAQLTVHDRKHAINSSSDHEDIAAGKLIGSGAETTGPPREITIGDHLSMSGTTLNVVPHTPPEIPVEEVTASSGEFNLSMATEKVFIVEITSTNKTIVIPEGSLKQGYAVTILIDLYSESTTLIENISWVVRPTLGSDVTIPSASWHLEQEIDTIFDGAKYLVSITNVSKPSPATPSASDLRISFINA